MLAALFSLILATPALADDQAALERELGFELPEPYRFIESHETPLSLPCSELVRSDHPQVEQDCWVISGTVGQALYNAERWQGTPQFHDLLVANAWQVETSTSHQIGDPLLAADFPDIDQRPEFGRPDSYIRSGDAEEGVCLRRLVRDYGYLDAIALTVHIYPCEPT